MNRDGYLSHDWTNVDRFVPDAMCAGCGVDAQDDDALEDCPLRARGGDGYPDGPLEHFALCRVCGGVSGPFDGWDLDDAEEAEESWYDHGVPKLDHDDGCDRSPFNVGAFVALGLGSSTE